MFFGWDENDDIYCIAESSAIVVYLKEDGIDLFFKERGILYEI